MWGRGKAVVEFGGVGLYVVGLRLARLSVRGLSSLWISVVMSAGRGKKDVLG